MSADMGGRRCARYGQQGKGGMVEGESRGGSGSGEDLSQASKLHQRIRQARFGIDSGVSQAASALLNPSSLSINIIPVV